MENIDISFFASVIPLPLNSATEPTNVVQALMLFAMSCAVLALGGLFIWLYWSAKPKQAMLTKSVENRSAGSFIGFWGRNKTRIYGFLAAIFIFTGLMLAIFVVFGVFPYTTWR